MKINLEEIKKENNFITVFDDDGMVSIQMSKDSLMKIFDMFDWPVTSKRPWSNRIIEVTEFGETFSLDLSLEFEGDGFSITGSRVDTTNFYNDFELEYCDYETWVKIQNVTKN